MSWVAALSLGLFLYHMAVDRQYGFHGDEMYFLMCGYHPAWGYVDHPPFVPMIARLSSILFGETMFAVRFFPAVSLSLSALLTGLLARRLGAGTFGQCLATLSFLCAPAYLRGGAFLNIPSFEGMFWLLMAHALVSLGKTKDPRWWLAVGLVAGLSLLNKHTTLLFGGGIVVGLILTRQRGDFLSPWVWLGGLVALLIFLPNLLWQYRHDWATVDFIRNLNAEAMQRVSIPEFVAAQLLFINLFCAPVWLAGLWFYLVSKRGRDFRVLGWVFATIAVLLLVAKSKVYYLMPAYPMLLAAGAFVIEAGTQKAKLRWLRFALPAAIIAFGCAFVPMSSPVGTLEFKERYISKALGGLVNPRDVMADFRYETGWPEQVAAVRGAFEALSAEQRRDCVVLTGSYAEASAINILGKREGLPMAISGHNAYATWGPQGATGACVLAYGVPRELLEQAFRSVQPCGTVPSPIGPESQNGRALYLCQEPVAPLTETWRLFRHYG